MDYYWSMKNDAESIVTSLHWSKELQKHGFPQEGANFVWVEAGQKFGDGYHTTADSLTKQGLYFVGGDYGDLGKGHRTADGEARYSGTIEFPAVHVPEYGSDNSFEYPVSCAAPTAEEILRRLPGRIDANGMTGILKIKVPYATWFIVGYTGHHEEGSTLVTSPPNLANAAAAMYCYLAENGLLPKA